MRSARPPAQRRLKIEITANHTEARGSLQINSSSALIREIREIRGEEFFVSKTAARIKVHVTFNSSADHCRSILHPRSSVKSVKSAVKNSSFQRRRRE